ncbi:MAG TPA: MBL fold metallo-hydrolase [Chthoniobacterales bacterium]|nr:MBL fold metallo-hydrolase [Chthoniobacterales bacterium]
MKTLAIFLCGASILVAQTPAPSSPAPSRTQVVMLGTGNPAANPERSGPSVAIVVNDTPYLIDCGPGVVRRASAALRKGVAGLVMPKLKTLFVTHLHSDHTLGYADLIFSPWVLGRKDALESYGPAGLKAMTDHLLAAYSEDIAIRTDGLEHGNRTGYKVNAHEIKPGVVYKDENVTVKAFPVHHGSWKEAYGYRFETPDKVIVLSGDCAPSDSVIENCNGCDVLLHEVYTQLGYEKTKDDWRNYITSFHTSTKELATLATKAKPKKLVLYHQMFFGGDKDTEEGLLKEMHSLYQGDAVSANDLDIY